MLSMMEVPVNLRTPFAKYHTTGRSGRVPEVEFSPSTRRLSAAVRWECRFSMHYWPSVVLRQLVVLAVIQEPECRGIHERP